MILAPAVQAKNINNAMEVCNSKKELYVAVGLVFNNQGEILVSLRKEPQPYAGYWEFPGGKLEDGETSLIALKRELCEEVGIKIITATPFLSARHDYQTYFVNLDVWQIYQFTGNACGLEGQMIDWVKPDLLTKLNFLPANSFILDAIRGINE
jgi:8-oxo-dGTP diphosphatase